MITMMIIIILNIVAIIAAFCYGNSVIKKIDFYKNKSNKYFLRTFFVGTDDYTFADNSYELYKGKNYIR